MVTYHCRLCGSVTEIPVYFSIARQRIFVYIWKHPGCTKHDIAMNVYGREVATNAIGVHLSKIRRELFQSDFRLIHAHLRKEQFGNKRPRRYYIKPSVGKTAKQPTEGIADGTV